MSDNCAYAAGIVLEATIAVAMALITSPISMVFFIVISCYREDILKYIEKNRIGHKVRKEKSAKLAPFQLQRKGQKSRDIVAAIPGVTACAAQLQKEKWIDQKISQYPKFKYLEVDLDNEKINVDQAVKLIRTELFNEQQRAFDETNLRKYEASPDKDKASLHLGDFTDTEFIKKCVKAESVDEIFTDPLYAEEFLYLYEKLPRLASYALKPGASMIINLPDVLGPALYSVLP